MVGCRSFHGYLYLFSSSIWATFAGNSWLFNIKTGVAKLGLWLRKGLSVKSLKLK